MHIHILGICGTFMGGLALIARAAGHRVTGCDSNVYPPMSTQLEEQGIELIQGFDASQTALRPDLFVIGNVITRGNPLLEAILDRKLPYTSGPQWLGQELLRNQHVIAIAGTHGKTSTTAMTAWILEHSGRKPNFLVGGIAADLGTSARYSRSASAFVIEADEYDTAFFDKRSKFVHYHPDALVFGNLEFDHADIFDDLAAIQRQFHHLLRIMPSRAAVIYPDADPAIEQTLNMGCWSRRLPLNSPSSWQARLLDEAGCSFEVLHQGRSCGQIHWQLTGRHNVSNALAAIAACTDYGAAPQEAVAALNAFRGIKRRMELRGEVEGIRVYDDFAHHPTAIKTTLQGLRAKVGNARILAVLEPRSNTMKLGTMAQRLPEALADADQAYCFMQTQGKHALGWDPQTLFAQSPQPIRNFTDTDVLINALQQEARKGDHIVVMSNGAFDNLHQRLLEALRTATR